MWRMLHTLAERLGRAPLTIQQHDERHIWLSFMRLLEHVMPCVRCRMHYRDYVLRYPLDRSMGFVGEPLRRAASFWLFRLHNEINAQNRKSLVPIEALEGMYSKRPQSELQLDVQELAHHLNDAAQARLIQPDGLRAFRAQLVRLRQTTG